MVASVWISHISVGGSELRGSSEILMVSLDVDLELDSLFQKHNIDELEGILMKIRSEADKKKFDLRRLVG